MVCLLATAKIVVFYLTAKPYAFYFDHLFTHRLKLCISVLKNRHILHQKYTYFPYKICYIFAHLINTLRADIPTGKPARNVCYRLSVDYSA